MKELNNRRTRKDSESSTEVPDFVFNYSDSDALAAEISEWYTYSEEPEFIWNKNAFNSILFKDNPKNYLLQEEKESAKWASFSRQEKKSCIIRLLDQTDISDGKARENVYRAILYLAQGAFDECESIDDYNTNLIENVILLHECDAFYLFIDLFIFEIDNLCANFSMDTKYASCITDNADLRVILSVLYTLIEAVRCYSAEVSAGRMPADRETDIKVSKIKSELKNELSKPIPKINEILSSYLFQLISKFCNQNVIVLPIKKIILLLWKVMLLTLGALDDAFSVKNETRKKFGLQILDENPSLILNNLTPATPPPNPVDLANELQFSSASSYKRKKNSLMKQTKGIESDDVTTTNATTNNSGRVIQLSISSANNLKTIETNETSSYESDEKKKDDDSYSDESNSKNSNLSTLEESEQETSMQNDSVNEANEIKPNHVLDLPRPKSPPQVDEPKSPPPESTNNRGKIIEAANDAAKIKLQLINQVKNLPWKPKVRLNEIESFLDQERRKFFGYGDLTNDLDTLIGLPYPIHESVRILRQHLYVSLSEEQIKLEEKFQKYPLSTREQCEKEDELNADNSSEILFCSLLHNLPQYLICLLKILLTSVPQTRPKTDSLQIMSDLFPDDLSGSHFHTIKLGIDSNRHKEILIKAISAILLLMLKHFKVNHVYKFEFVTQHLLFANCIPLILKFFNLNISSFIQSKSNHVYLDFPNCVIGKQPELDATELENGDSAVFRWRNVFSCINLLRILNKLTKYKRSRVMMLVIFKSAPILKKVLRIKQAMLQYYALKLLKMQTRHLGRQWRKTNMSTMSAIYQKVRHRLNDDWAFGNEQETQGWDFQSDECALRTKIDKYIQRKYKINEETPAAAAAATAAAAAHNDEFTPTDNSLFGCLKQDIKLPDNFSNDYENWLNEEIFENKIDWDVYLKQQGSSDSANLIIY